MWEATTICLVLPSLTEEPPGGRLRDETRSAWDRVVFASAAIAAPHTCQCLYRIASNPFTDCDSPSQ